VGARYPLHVCNTVPLRPRGVSGMVNGCQVARIPVSNSLSLANVLPITKPEIIIADLLCDASSRSNMPHTVEDV
jgi:hypothetical protein